MNLKTLLWLSPGTQVSHHKETANLPTEQLPVPEKVILPMRQHVGAACEACVQKGDRVLVGTMVGRAPSAMSVHIYSSVSGTVSSVEQILYNAGETTPWWSFRPMAPRPRIRTSGLRRFMILIALWGRWSTPALWAWGAQASPQT